MKKVVGSLLVASLLLLGTSTFADTVSLVGKKVEGTFTVKKDGVMVMSAVIINGKAYAPVRSIAEASGLDVKVEGKTINMISEPKEAAPVLPPDVPTGKELTKEEILEKIEHKKINISELEKRIAEYEGLAKELEHNGTLGQNALENADRYRVYVNKHEAELKELQDKLAELQ